MMEKSIRARGEAISEGYLLVAVVGDVASGADFELVGDLAALEARGRLRDLSGGLDVGGERRAVDGGHRGVGENPAQCSGFRVRSLFRKLNQNQILPMLPISGSDPNMRQEGEATSKNALPCRFAALLAAASAKRYVVYFRLVYLFSSTGLQAFCRQVFHTPWASLVIIPNRPEPREARTGYRSGDPWGDLRLSQRIRN